MPCRSGSPHPVLVPWVVLALRAGATFSRTMTARTIPTTARTSRSRFLISTSGGNTLLACARYTRGRCMSRIRYLAIAAVVATLAGWLFWPGDEGPQLIARPVSVSYDPDARRLTATVNIQNSGNRAVVASITNDVFVDSRKQPSNDRTQSQPWELELRLKQMN